MTLHNTWDIYTLYYSQDTIQRRHVYNSALPGAAGVEVAVWQVGLSRREGLLL